MVALETPHWDQKFDCHQGHGMSETESSPVGPHETWEKSPAQWSHTLDILAISAARWGLARLCGGGYGYAAPIDD
jgi:hypothetical protein